MRRVLQGFCALFLLTGSFSHAEEDPLEFFCDHFEQIDLEKDYSVALGSHAVTNFYDQFLEQIFKVYEQVYVQAKEVIKKYPDDQVSQKWQKDLDQFESALEKRNQKKQIFAFIAGGFFPHRAFLDPSRFETLKRLQNEIFLTSLKEVGLWMAFSEEKMDAEALYSEMEKLESHILRALVLFCEDSIDPFFHDEVSECLAGRTSRLEIAENTLPFQWDEEEMDQVEMSEAEQAFAQIDEFFESKLEELIDKTLTQEAIEELGRCFEAELPTDFCCNDGECAADVE